jgi:hypothetical protein
MKDMFKRILVLILSVAMILSLIAISTEAVTAPTVKLNTVRLPKMAQK